MKKITFRIGKDGTTTIVDAVGYGSACTSTTANVERRLGFADEGSRAATENMYAPSEELNAEAGLG